MSTDIFEATKEKWLKQKTASLELLEKNIAEKLEAPAHAEPEAVARLQRARTSAAAAIERLRLAHDGELEVAVANVDQALRSAYERLDAAARTVST